MKQLQKLKLSLLAVFCAIPLASPASALSFTASGERPAASRLVPVKMDCGQPSDCAATPKRQAAKNQGAPQRSVRRESIFVNNDIYANSQSGQYGHYGFYGQSGTFGATGFRTQYNLGGYDHTYELKMN